MQKYLCKIGLHKYVSINMTDCYRSSYGDKGPTANHIVWYQQCSCCSKRRMKENYRKEVKQVLGYTVKEYHNGIEYARVGWETYGRMYLGSGKETTLPPTAPKPTKTKFKVVDGGKT